MLNIFFVECRSSVFLGTKVAFIVGQVIPTVHKEVRNAKMVETNLISVLKDTSCKHKC